MHCPFSFKRIGEEEIGMSVFEKISEKLTAKLRLFSASRGYVCDSCGAEVFAYPEHRFCVTCEKNMRKNDGLRCGKCGRKTVAEGVCLGCKQRLPKFTKGVSPFVYRGDTASLINRIKNGKPRLAYFFGETMAEELLSVCPELLRFKTKNEQGRVALSAENVSNESNVKNASAEKEEALLVLPVPMTAERKKERGYNQAAELAIAVYARLRSSGLEAELDTGVLCKRREASPQKQLGYVARAENVAGLFHVHKRSACKGRTVVLVDDIMTTGATGSECAARLLGAGAKTVYFLIAAALPEQHATYH